ncbi:MAG: hypothetical protein ACTTIO_02340 [Candidatus Fimenecus sp.]
MKNKEPNKKSNHLLNFIVFAATLTLIFTIIHFMPNVLSLKTESQGTRFTYTVDEDYSQKNASQIPIVSKGYKRIKKPLAFAKDAITDGFSDGSVHGDIAVKYHAETLLDNKLSYKLIKNTYNGYAYTITGEKTPEVVWTVVVNVENGTEGDSFFVLKEGKYNGK